ncbi:hypothetical protein Tco_0617818 [Tanacetum coccineum]
MAEQKIHPALTISSIKNTFTVELSLENGQYLSWSELFKIHCRAYKVIDHIIPPPPPATSSIPPPKDAPRPKVVDPETWSTLDAIVSMKAMIMLQVSFNKVIHSRHSMKLVPVPTELDQAFNTMSFNPPDDQWYMDTGATSHMTTSPYTFSSYFKLSIPKHILVGNGNTIPIRGYGHMSLPSPYPPLHLKNVLHAPHLIKNLIYVRRLLTDNNLTIAFDPYGFLFTIFRRGYQSCGVIALGIYIQSPVPHSNNLPHLLPLLPFLKIYGITV